MSTTLYRFFDADGALLYVGITKNGAQRWHEHSKSKEWWGRVASTTVEHYDTRAAALDAERAAIVAERPLFNVVHNVTHKGEHLVERGTPDTIPSFDNWWMPGALRLAYIDAMKAIDALIHLWQREVDDDVLHPIVDGIVSLEISDMCSDCDEVLPPLMVLSGGEARYSCKCGNTWRCWWNLDRRALAEVR